MTDINEIIQAPIFAKQKKKLHKKQILPAYEVINSRLYLYTLGSHENFYRNLKKYMQH